MKVILLGAGASKSYIDSPTKIQMPIAMDFFNSFYQLPIASNPWVLIGDIISFLYEYKNITPTEAINYLTSGVSIEELHSEIGEIRDNYLEQKIFFPVISTSYKAYNQLLFLFASVLNEIQNGPISLAHKHIASVLNTDD